MTMSKIQLAAKFIEEVHCFECALNNITDKYLVEDNIFSFKNGELFEISRGYFVTIGEADTLKGVWNCLQNNSLNNVGVRIIGNSKYQVGYIRNTLLECSNDDNVYDINRMSSVR